MYSVYVLRNYVNSEELRDYLERNGFETSIISKITGSYVDERKDQYAIQTFADGYFAAFTYNGDKWPPQRVFKKINNDDGIIEFEAVFGDEPSFND